MSNFGITHHRSNRRSRLLLLVGLLAFGAVGLALILQHGLDMQPCAWCTLQRLIFILVGMLAWLGWMTQKSAKPSLALIVPAIGLCMAGIAAALYQQFVAAKSQSCALSLADKIIKSVDLDQLAPWMFKATAFCHEANLPLLGVSFAFWSAALFAILDSLLLLSVLRVRPR